jgi:signal transduction histidine kinase
MNKETKLIKGFINEDLKDVIVLLLDLFSDQTGLVIALYGSDGKEVWCKCEGRFSSMCGYIKKKPHLWKLCQHDHSSRASINQFQTDEKADITICHLGLSNITLPICHENVFYGSLLTGQKIIAESKSTSGEVFSRRTTFLMNQGLITIEEANILNRHFENVDVIENFPKEDIERLVNIETRLIGLIQNLINRIKKITLLRHELHQPNINTTGSLIKTLDNLKKVKQTLEKGPDAKQISGIISDVQYAINNSKLFSVIIENICASVSEDQVALHIRRHNIITLVEDAIRIFGSSAEDKDVIFEPIVTRDLDTMYLEIDKGLIMRALINAYHNAVKYSYYGQNENAPRTIGTKLFNLDHYFRISISNFGIGILEFELNEVWKQGYRGILSSDRHRTGSGFGLYQIKNIVEAHGGQVNIQSKAAGKSYTGPYLTVLTIDLPYSQIKGE